MWGRSGVVGRAALIGVLAVLGGCTSADFQGAGGDDDFGVTCLVDADCGGGLSCVLVDGSAGYICTRGCSGDGSCPDGAACVETILGSYCSTDPRSEPDDGFTDPNQNPDQNPDQNPGVFPDPDPTPNPDPDQGDCNDDADCGQGQVCTGGACVDDGEEGCQTDGDCSQGQICDQNTNECIQEMVPGECSDDRFEPNETFGQAEVIQAGQFDGMSICAGDEDFYRMALVAGTTLEVTLSFSPDAGVLGLQLVDGQGQSLQTSLGNNGAASLTRQIAQAGSYGIRVFGQSPGGENIYDMTVGVSDVDDSCQDDGREPNDTAGQASTIGDGVQNLTACAGSDDWFRFTADAGAAITASISFTHSLGDLNLFLFQSDGVTMLDSAQGTGNQESISITAPLTGEYVLRVTSSNQEGGSTYSLTLDGAGQNNNNNNACPDNLEPNDSSGGARALQPGAFPLLALCTQDPSDWYSISLNAGDQISADLFSLDFLSTLALEIVSSNGSTVLDGTPALLGIAEVSATVQTSGTYYVHALHLLGDAATYSMGINVVEAPDPPDPPSCGDDLGEPNESHLDAVALNGPFNNAVACPDDADYYQIEVAEAGASLSIQATFTTDFGDVDLELFDTDGTTSLTQATARGAGETLNYALTDAGTYFVRAFLGSGDATTYSISASSDFEPNCNDRFEPNNTHQEATPITAGSYDTLDVCANDGDDFFAIDLVAGDVITATINFTDSTADLDLDLLGTNGTTVLDSSSGVLDSEEVTDTITVDGTYFIRVEHYSGDPNAYTMTIDVESNSTPECQDQFEPNNTFETAPVVAPGRYDDLGVCSDADNDDYYAVEVSAAGTLQVDIFFTHGDGDIDMRLLNTDGVSVMGSSITSSNDESISESITTPGTYYIQVYGFLGNVTNSYDLNISLQ